MRSLKNYLRRRDQLAQKSNTLLHYMNDFPQTTTFGGILSLLIELYVMIAIVLSFKKLIFSENPYISTIDASYEDSANIIYPNEAASV
jgi:uncharacterized membrane protein